MAVIHPHSLMCISYDKRVYKHIIRITYAKMVLLEIICYVYNYN